MRGDTPPMQLPLEDVKILDLSHALAGPFCSTMLGDFAPRSSKSRSQGPVTSPVAGVPLLPYRDRVLCQSAPEQKKH